MDTAECEVEKLTNNLEKLEIILEKYRLQVEQAEMKEKEALEKKRKALRQVIYDRLFLFVFNPKIIITTFKD